MIIYSANLGRGVSPAIFERNLRRVLSAGGHRAVFCFQEIDEADAPHEMLILRALTSHTHQIVGQSTAVPILVPRRFGLISETQTLAAKGLAKFTPHRVINEAVIALGPNLDVAILNTHLPINRPQTFTRRRQVRKKLRAVARKHEAGIWTADTNTKRFWPTIVPGEVDVISADIDKAKAWGPSDRRLVVQSLGTVDLTIDGHDAHGARVIWRKR